MSDGNVITDVEGLCEDDRQAGRDVAENTLQRQGDASAGDTQTGNQRQEFNAKILHGHDREEHEYEDLRHPREQGSHGRFELETR